MEDKEKLIVAQDWVKKLANGINPLNGNAVKEDDIVNNVHISRCLFYVADVLGKKIERKTRSISDAISNSTRTTPFDSSAVKKDGYNYADAISISAFAREMGKLVPENMQVPSNKIFMQWLIQKGLLVEVGENGRKWKIASEKGNEIGIHSEDQERDGKIIHLTFYNREAQKYLLEHLDEISKMAV
ncbi:MAG: hypothetical protein IJ920_03185 [Paludibacteraceae bacterium]|nr:hypothetical protein [Paludibacteraceae bacterium]